MARQSGTLKLEGTLGELSFYKSVFGYIVRRKGGASKLKIRKHKNFKSLREYQTEFSNCVAAGKLLRQALKYYTHQTPDHTLVWRTNQLMQKIKDQDRVSERGKRTVAAGISTAEGSGLLSGFDFTLKYPLKTILKKRPRLVNGQIHLAALDMQRDLNAPKGATHVRLTAAASFIDFTASTHVVSSESVMLGMKSEPRDVLLSPDILMSTGLVIYSLQILFLQEVNGEMVELREKAAMGLIGTVDL